MNPRRLRALTAGLPRLTAPLMALTLALTAHAGAQVPAPQPAPAPTANPLTRRESQVVVYGRLERTPASNLVVIVDRLPAGASLVAGSSRLLRGPELDEQARPKQAWVPTGQEEALPEPVIQDSRAFWVVRAGANQTFGVAYTLAHSSAITLSERPGLVLGLPGVRPIGAARIPGGPSAPPLDSASELEDALGVGDLRQLAGEDGLIGALLAAQPLSTAATPARAVGGPATRVSITPLRTTTDLADAPTLLIEVFDADGKPANDAEATVKVTPEPFDTDSNPAEVGFQVQLSGGQGRVRLSTPSPDPRRNETLSVVRAEARITNANGTVSSSGSFKLDEFSVRDLAPQDTPVQGTQRPTFGVGAVGVQLNFTPSAAVPFSVDGSAQAFFRAGVLDGSLLTLGVNQQATLAGGVLSTSGSLLPPAQPFERFPLTGDASLPGSDASSGDGFYLRLERGPSFLTYGRMNPEFKGLLSLYNPYLNGLRANYASDALSGNAFAALVPVANQVFRTAGDGTAVYLLPNVPVAAGSEQVKVVTFDRDSAALKLSELVLERGADYTIDYPSGRILLTKPLLARDANGNPQFLAVAYAAEGSGAPNELRAGAQGRYQNGGFSVTGTVLRFSAGASPLFGLSAAYQAGGLGLGLETAYSGGFGVAGQLNLSGERYQLQARVEQRFDGFVDPDAVAPSPPGRTARADASFNITNSLSLNAQYALSQNFAAGSGAQSASVQAKNDFGLLSAGLGFAGTWTYAPGSSSSAAYVLGTLEAPAGPFKFGVRQRVAITPGTASDTLLQLDYGLTQNLNLTASDLISYGGGVNGVRQQAFFGLTGRFSNAELLRRNLGGDPRRPEPFGTTNLSAGYGLDTLGGEAGRFRLDLDTTLPITDTLSAQLAAEAGLASSNATGSFAAGLLYQAGDTRASGRAQFSLSNAGLKQVYTASAVTRLTPDFVLSPSAEYDRLEDGRTGTKFSLAGALRGERWSVLTNTTLRGGFFGDLIEGELRASYEADERLFLRPGVAYRFGGGLFTGQAGLGATYYVTDTIGLGASAAYQFQQAGAAGIGSSGKLSLGAEASLRVAPGLVLAGGVNFIGFSGIGTTFKTDPGFYIRLDYLFDETLFNR